MNYDFELSFKVRDYECDMQGIVNNAVYHSYLEHARSEFLNHTGIGFDKLRNAGIEGLVVKIEIDYKYPLKSGEEFVCKLKTAREGNLKFVFFQDIYRLPDLKPIIKGKVITDCINNLNGRPVAPNDVVEVFERYPENVSS